MPLCLGDLKRDPNVENCPHGGGLGAWDRRFGEHALGVDIDLRL